ncbi:MAG: RNA polymerase sigma factor [Bryobacteraceae bacterium]|nr:RNA polymerase sigma factor [Bryobacteraceae bacterium]
MRRSAKGDESAFTDLYRRRQQAVYRFALGMSGRSDVAEEVTQDVFLSVIRQPGRFDESRGTVQSFLFGIARNLVLRHCERDRRDVFLQDDRDVDLEADTPDVLASLATQQTVAAVREAVLRLPPSYREVVVLCDLEEMSYAAAAEVLGVPVGTVRSRLNRGRGLLLEKLRWYEGGRFSVGCSA